MTFPLFCRKLGLKVSKLKKIILILLIYLSIYLNLPTYAQDKKATVLAEKVTIYAEASEKSYAIESVKKGTILTLFTQPREETEWLYVTFYSKRYKGMATGFIQTSMVVLDEKIQEEPPVAEVRSEEAITQPEKAKEKEPGEFPSLKETFAPKEAEKKKDKELKSEEPSEEPVKQKYEIMAPEEKSPEKVEEVIEPEIEPEEKPKPEEEIPAVEEESPKKEEEAKEEILEDVPQAQEVAAFPVKMEKAEEFKRDEVFPKPEIKITITPVDMDLPEHRPVIEPAGLEAEEPRVFAVIQRVMPPPPPRDVKAKADTAAEKPIKEKPFEIKVPKPEMKEAVAEPRKEETPPPVPVKVEKEKMEEVKEEPEPEIPAQPEEDIPVEAKAEEKRPGEEIGKKTPEEAVEKSSTKKELKEEPQVVKPPEQVIPPKDIIGRAAPPKRSLLTMCFGYGVSQGGLGTFVQFNTKSGLSLHAGVGYYPASAFYSQYDWLKNEVLYSIGIKYYLPFGSSKLHPYIDLQYGGISVEAVQVVSEIWYGDYVYENIQKILYGPSILGGVEFRVGVLGINAALGLTYNTTEWDYWDQDLFLNGDFGVVIYF